MRLGVVGSRKWTNRKLVWKHLGAWYKKYGKDLHIVSGGCPEGPDAMAEQFARQRGISFTIHPAKWRDDDDVLNKAAGFLRNTTIVEDTDAILGFWDFSSGGTADTLTKCRWRQPHRLMYVVNPVGRVFAGREVWGEEAGAEYAQPSTFKVTKKLVTVERCQAHPETIYVFGDNLIGKGKAGQAIIRDEPNAFGVPTKKYPNMEDRSFFTDDEFEENKRLMEEAVAKIPAGRKIVVPQQIGCNLAQLPMRAPKTYAFLCELLQMDNPFDNPAV